MCRHVRSSCSLIILLWFPLLLLSIPGTTKPNPVISVTTQLQIAGFEPFYLQSVTSQYIKNFTEADFNRLRSNEDYRTLFSSFYSSGNLQQISLQKVFYPCHFQLSSW